MDKLERIRNLTIISNQMELLKRDAVNHDSKKELADARYKKIQKIQKELQELADTLGNQYILIEKIPVHIFWLNQDGSGHYPQMIFDNGKVSFEEWSYGSSLSWTDMTNIPKERIYKYNQDDEIIGDWVRFLKNWETIRNYVEAKIEKALMKRIQSTQTQVSKFKERYEKEVLDNEE